MKKKIIILLFIGLVVITGCVTQKDSIKIGEKQYVDQLVPVKIKGTNDTITITKRVKWEVPEHEPDETISFAIPVPYTIKVDGVEYKGIYELNDYNTSELDNNPKYEFTVTNLTSNGEIEVLITLK